MKIECKIIRDGGSKVDIGGIEYHFEPLDDGAHVAEVANPDHADRFLGIADGYKLYRGELSPKGEPRTLTMAVVNDSADVRLSESVNARVLHGSNVHQATYEIGGQTYQLGDIVSKAFQASGLTAEEWNALEADDREAKIDIALDDIADSAEKTPAADDRAALAEAYKAKFGSAPHYRLSIDKIKAALAEE